MLLGHTERRGNAMSSEDQITLAQTVRFLLKIVVLQNGLGGRFGLEDESHGQDEDK